MTNIKWRSGGTYTIPVDGGIELPSVTSVTGILEKPALVRWAANGVARAAVDEADILNQHLEAGDTEGAYDWLKGAPWRKSDKAAERGSSVHDILERVILGDEVGDIPESQRRYVNAGLQFIQDYSLGFEAAEATVFNLQHQYAGTLDALGVYQGGTDKAATFAIDWKTRQGKSVKQARVYDNERLQVAAYVHAEMLLLPDGSTVEMPELAGGTIVMLCEDGYETGRVTEADWEGFLHARRLWEWRANL